MLWCIYISWSRVGQTTFATLAVLRVTELDSASCPSQVCVAGRQETRDNPFELLLSLQKLLQPPQPLLSILQHLIRLAHSKPQIVLHNRAVSVGVELARRDGGDAQLLDQEPGELEVARPLGHVRREGVVGGDLDLGEVHHDEVAALGLRVGDAELVPDGVEEVHFVAEVGDGLVPEAEGVGFFEAWRTGVRSWSGKGRN